MPPILLPLLLLLASAGAIYGACGFFVNGVEWVGRRLAVGSAATATVLAAFGTALPESIVTLVAVLGGAPDGQALGVGAALGGPLALATIAYATVGITLLLTGQRLRQGTGERAFAAGLRRDQLWFLAIFAVKVLLGLILFGGKAWTGLLFLGAYALYLRRQLADRTEDDQPPPAPLRFDAGASEPAGWRVWGQTLAALAVIFLGSHLFVQQLGVLSPLLGIPAQTTALLLAPIATELPETMNAIIWVRAGKHRMALGNISGAMMIQATVPTAFGLFFTPWHLERGPLIGAAITFAAIATLYLASRRGVASRRLFGGMGLFYGLFVVLLLVF